MNLFLSYTYFFIIYLLSPLLIIKLLLYFQVHGDQPQHWEPLYISDRDGLGMNRFQHHVFNYRGPTLAFFTVHDSTIVFCIALDQEWKDSKNFWGNEDCRLMQIRPQYRELESELWRTSFSREL